MSAIRKACNKLENGYEPPVTFVVVQKRHHTRLFPDNPQDECGRGKNVPPGTVVDSTIVHPVENDFFLVSHQGIQASFLLTCELFLIFVFVIKFYFIL